MEIFISYFMEYGFLFLFVIVLLEYMNLPGFPSGIIMPLAGLWIQKNGLSFTQGLIISVIAGLIGSWILYFLGRYGGSRLLSFYIKKFPKQKEVIEKNIKMIHDRGSVGIFISKLLPIARTIIPIPAGAIKFNFVKYTIFSTLGIIVWNFVFMWVGYCFGEVALAFFSKF